MHSTNSSPTPNPSITHQHMAVCGSTNSELLHSLAEAKIDKNQPYLLTASSQTAGRGQRTRTWQSPIGNIYLSLYHPLPVPISGLLSLVVGYHLTRLPIIQQINRQRRAVNLPIIGVKWANDIGYYDYSGTDSSRNPQGTGSEELSSCKQCGSFNKLAGILIEPVLEDNQITGVIVGIGINIEAAPILCETTKEGMDYQAISLTQIIKNTQLQFDCQSSNSSNQRHPGVSNSVTSFPRAEDLYRPVSATILRAINQFIGFKQDSYSLQQFINDYSEVNVLAGHRVQITQQLIIDSNNTSGRAVEPKLFNGEVVGLNQDGSLQLKPKNGDGIISVYTGTIRLI